MEIIQTIWNVYGIMVLAGLIFLLFTVWLDGRREVRQYQQEDYLLELYENIWNGTDEDRIAAWYRTIQHLKQWDYDERLIMEATDRMNRLKTDRSRRTFVNSSGRLIEKTEIK